MKNRKYPASPLMWILGAAGLLYVASAARYSVGYFSDDGRDILASLSLLQGGYRNLQLPGAPPLNFPLPGFPVVLASFVALIKPHWEWLKIVPLLSVLLSLWMVKRLFEPLLRPLWLTVLLVLFAFNPSTVAMSGRVMADATYLLGTLAAFLLFQNQLQKETPRGPWMLGVVLGVVGLLRPEGILLAAAIGATLLYLRRFRFLIISMGLFLMVWGAVMCRNYLMTGQSTGYSTIWLDTLAYLARDYRALLHQSLSLLETIGYQLLWGIGWPEGLWLTRPLYAVPLLIALVLLGHGLLISRRQKKDARGLLMALVLYMAFYLFVHLMWTAMDPHYVWPLLPFFLFFIIQGLDLQSSFALPKKIALGFVALAIAFLYSWQGVFSIRQSLGQTREGKIPRQTLEWIQAHTSADAFFLASNAPMVTLYSNRHAVVLLPARDIDDLRYQMIRRGVSHILAAPAQLLYVKTPKGRDPVAAWMRIQSAVPEAPDAFQLAYQAAEDSIGVYQVRSSPAFEKAYVAYQRSRQLREAGDAKASAQALEESIRLFPIAPALNAYAVNALLSGRSLEPARQRLDQALKLRPRWPIAWVNRARLFARLHQTAQAQADYARAIQLIEQTNDSTFLLPVIAREREALAS